MLTFKLERDALPIYHAEYRIVIPGRERFDKAPPHLCEHYVHGLTRGVRPDTLTISAYPFPQCKEASLSRLGTTTAPRILLAAEDSSIFAIRIWPSLARLIFELFPEDPYQTFYFAFNHKESEDV